MAETATIDNLDIQIAASSQNAESSLSKLLSAMDELSSKISAATSALTQQSKAASQSASATGKNSSALKTLSKTAEKASKSIAKIPRAFGRIALYRAIRTAIKNISASITEGLTNLKAYSQEVGTAFSPAVDNLRRHVLLLKNSFATALRPVIEALIPVIIQLVDWFSKLADFAAQVFSVLTGKVDDKGRYTKAVLSDLQQSNKQAKQLRRTLLGFDEINRLDGDTGSGESSNAGLMFTQAEVSDNAKEVAGRLQVIIDKVKEIFGAVKDFIKENPWILEVAGILLAAHIGLGAVEKVLNGILGIAKALLNPLDLIIAFFVASAIYGDEMSAWLKKASKKFEDFFKKLKNGISVTGDATLGAIGEIFGRAIETVGLISSAIYKLCHGDFQGALDDGLNILKNILKIAAAIVLGAINVVLGLFSDVVNGIASAWTWLHNKVFAPAINGLATFWENVKIALHNFGVNLKIAAVTLWKFLIERLNGGLYELENIVNEAIEIINWATGSEIKPVHFQIDTTNIDETLIELRDTKLPPLKETVEVIGQWRDPEKLKLQIDTQAAYAAIDNLGKKVNSLGTAVSSVVTAMGGQANKRTIVMKYASGGFPQVGSLFIAGESGAEYIADINGRTGVYNTDQMSAAMYKAMVAALSTMPSQGGGDIYLDGEVIYRNVVNRNNNQVRSTGRAALLT